MIVCFPLPHYNYQIQVEVSKSTPAAHQNRAFLYEGFPSTILTSSYSPWWRIVTAEVLNSWARKKNMGLKNRGHRQMAILTEQTRIHDTIKFGDTLVLDKPMSYHVPPNGSFLTLRSNIIMFTASENTSAPSTEHRRSNRTCWNMRVSINGG